MVRVGGDKASTLRQLLSIITVALLAGLAAAAAAAALFHNSTPDADHFSLVSHHSNQGSKKLTVQNVLARCQQSVGHRR